MNVQQQVFIRLRQRPGPSSQGRNTLPDRQVQALDECCRDRGPQTQLKQKRVELPALAPHHARDGERSLIALSLVPPFDQLTVQQQITH